MTAIRDAFAKAGGPSPMLAEFQVALSKIVETYRNRGLPNASIASALEGAAQSFRRKVDVGHTVLAQQGHLGSADDFSPSDGQKVGADKGQPSAASLGDSEFAGSVGHGDTADKAIIGVPHLGEPHSTQPVLAAIPAAIPMALWPMGSVGGGPFTPSTMLVGSSGHEPWMPQGEPNSRSADQTEGAADGQSPSAPLREPTPTEAGRVLQALKPRGPGAGAMRPGAFAARQAVRGESWLLTYQIPNGRDALSMRIGELLPTSQRMLRDGAGQMHAAVVLRRLHDEAKKLGQVSPDQIVGKTLPPAVIDRLSDELTPERVIVEAAKWGRKFVDERAAIAGGN